MTTLQRAAYKPALRRIGSKMYWAQSASRPQQHYLVDLNDNTCECVGFGHRGSCWHLTSAGALEALRQAQAQQQRAQVPAVVRPSGMDALLECFGAA